MKLAYYTLCILVGSGAGLCDVSCHKPSPVSDPEPSTPCKVACANFARLNCSAAHGSKERSCEVLCTRSAELHIPPETVKCWGEAADVKALRECGQIQCVQDGG